MHDAHVGVVEAGERALDIAAAFEFVADAAFGGYTAFVGRIRGLNRGERVVAVTYDMFDALALQRFREIAGEAAAGFGPGVRVWIEHAKGRIEVGGIAVVVAVGTPHRDEAFRACRQVIEAVKHTVPIWKQEHYVDGSSEWSEGCSLCHDA